MTVFAACAGVSDPSPPVALRYTVWAAVMATVPAAPATRPRPAPRRSEGESDMRPGLPGHGREKRGPKCRPPPPHLTPPPPGAPGGPPRPLDPGRRAGGL